MNFRGTYFKSNKKTDSLSRVQFLGSTSSNMILKTTKSKTLSIKIEVKSIQILESPILVGHFPLTFEEEIKRAEEILKAMKPEQKRKLAQNARGIWKDYPDDWFDKIFEKIPALPYDAISESDYVLFG